MTTRKAPIQLQDLVFAWRDDSPDNIYYFDKLTGEVRLVNRNLLELKDLTDEIELHRERYLYLPKANPKVLKDDLTDFKKTVSDQKRQSVLDIAFESPHVYSAFKKILAAWEGESERLEQFLDARARLRVFQWLEGNCIETDSLKTSERD
ncbi:MAG: UPF0158 family protein [Candidatus Obscuribacterales bacterium]|nr:UPF0158 family protein [Candidatus Obscuribacterales bacterium]